jgi:hypothetical protein
MDFDLGASLGFEVKDLGFRVWGLEFKITIWGSRFKTLGFRF